MKLILLIPSLFLYLASFAQNKDISDSTLNEMCKTLNSTANKALPDTDRIKAMLVKHIAAIFENLDETEQNKAVEFIFFRLQRNCNEFQNILLRAEPLKGEWEIVDQKPLSSLTKINYDDFIKCHTYYYMEGSGDTTHVTITGNIWEDHFTDGTYSRLKLRWLNNASFELEFVESNNNGRKNYSKPGDKFIYELLQKDDNKYKVSVEIPGRKPYNLFYLHREK
jgi:hypothetical protein